MADLRREFWILETGTGQQVAQLHDRYMMIMMFRCGRLWEILSLHRSLDPVLGRMSPLSVFFHSGSTEGFFGKRVTSGGHHVGEDNVTVSFCQYMHNAMQCNAIMHKSKIYFCFLYLSPTKSTHKQM